MAEKELKEGLWISRRGMGQESARSVAESLGKD